MVSLAEKGDKEPVTPALDKKCVWSMTSLEGLDRQRVFPPHPQPLSVFMQPVTKPVGGSVVVRSREKLFSQLLTSVMD